MRNSGSVVTEHSVVHLVEENVEESSDLFIQIGLKLQMDLDDEGRGHCREQTSLSCESASINKR